jgi:hypothetical protein
LLSRLGRLLPELPFDGLLCGLLGSDGARADLGFGDGRLGLRSLDALVLGLWELADLLLGPGGLRGELFARLLDRLLCVLRGHLLARLLVDGPLH